MERVERQQLQALHRHLQRDLVLVSQLLKSVTTPLHRRSDKQIKQRISAICQAINARGDSVTKEQLREICSKHGLRFTSVGSLYSGGYVRDAGNRVVLTKRGALMSFTRGHLLHLSPGRRITNSVPNPS